MSDALTNLVKQIDTEKPPATPAPSEGVENLSIEDVNKLITNALKSEMTAMKETVESMISEAVKNVSTHVESTPPPAEPKTEED